MKSRLIFFVFLAVFLIAGCDSTSLEDTGAMSTPNSLSHSYIETITISADASDVALPARFYGWYLAQVEIVTSADDAVTLTVNSPNGGEIGTITTTAATGGEFMSLAAAAESRYITGTPTYTLADMASGTATAVFVLVR